MSHTGIRVATVPALNQIVNRENRNKLLRHFAHIFYRSFKLFTRTPCGAL